MKKIVIFVAGTKGGVGKSFFALQAAAAAQDLELSLRVYDSDTENKTLQTFLGKDSIYLDDTNESYPLDPVINGLLSDDPADVTIVDMKAGTSRRTQDWFSSVPWEELPQDEIAIVIAGCFTSDPESVRTFIPWPLYFGHIDFPVHYLLIQNQKDGNNFDAFGPVRKVFEQMNQAYDLIEFPAMDQAYITLLNIRSVPLREIVIGTETSIFYTVMERSRLKRNYRSFTDPLISFYGRYMDQMTEGQKALLSQVERRLKNAAAGKGE